MVEIGKLNTLRVVKEVDFGLYLDGIDRDEILLPLRYIPAGCQVDDDIEVFIYLDSEDRIIATTEKPFAMVGQFAFLEVVAVNSVGAFMDWGLPKDLLVPFSEQKVKMEEGKSYTVFLYFDEASQRIVASGKLEKFIDHTPVGFQEGDEVDLLVCNQTDLGYSSIINGTHMGMLYKNEVFQPLSRGQKVKGYIKKLREDNKIDLILYKPGYEKVDDFSDVILEKLKDQGGFIAVTDKSPSEEIYKLFGVSKKTYKKAVGALYKQKLISLEEDGIKLI